MISMFSAPLHSVRLMPQGEERDKLAQTDELIH